ncbi:hypothetical protein GCM10009599_11300 [Luteococcus peritonei]
MTSRGPNRASSIYHGQGRLLSRPDHRPITVGYKDDGTLDRRHVMSKDRAKVTRKVRELEKDRAKGAVAQPGRKWSVASWLKHWLDVIAAPNLRPSSLAAYRTAVEKHLIPNLGKEKLDRLQPEHLERLYRKVGSGVECSPVLVEGMVLAAPAAMQLELDPASADVECIACEADHVERVHHRRGCGEFFGGSGLEAGEAVHRDDLDAVAPGLGLL